MIPLDETRDLNKFEDWLYRQEVANSIELIELRQENWEIKNLYKGLIEENKDGGTRLYVPFHNNRKTRITRMLADIKQSGWSSD